MSTLNLTTSKPTDLKVDALVVGVAKGPRGVIVVPGAQDVDKAFQGRLAKTVEALGGTGAAGEVTKVPSLGATSAPVVVAVGLGEEKASTGRRSRQTTSYDVETLRRAAGAASRALAGTRRVGLALPAEDAASAEAVAQGALLGAYGYVRYRVASKDNHKDPVETFSLVSSAGKDSAVKAAVEHARTVSAAVHLARDWVNTPPLDLPPAEFAAVAVAAATEAGLKVEVLDEKALKKQGYGGILGVGQGSSRPPRLLKLTYTSRKAKQHLALVGKGITFDSGGLSLKPSQAMEAMKSDMGGAAAVIAAMTAIARIKPDVNVTGWAPMAENMPSGTAQRPSDVLTIYGGKTVENGNSDAEGRLVLADALARSAEDNPDLVVDVATLTGACVVALGERTAGVMSNDHEVTDQVLSAAESAGEPFWPLPIPDEIRPKLESKVADLRSVSGDRWGGASVAAAFLREFVPENTPWAHLDIAGPAFHEGKPYGYVSPGGTGASVRTLIALAQSLAG